MEYAIWPSDARHVKSIRDPSPIRNCLGLGLLGSRLGCVLLAHILRLLGLDSKMDSPRRLDPSNELKEIPGCGLLRAIVEEAATDPQVSMSELSSISLYTRRLVEERPKWKPHGIFKDIHPNKPYLHQLSCSWGAVFFPKQWREFYVYMNMRFTGELSSSPSSGGSFTST
ncbi:hypothetical protein SAY86_005139 [Trapa natans]|uniref:Uncharacterized protein n=1 Tax=Trapa natans TaxID=22666 RepID=A0AAN7L868_TRANT|nr:hypothetical protein SAY86_005139 [Trapa natans]